MPPTPRRTFIRGAGILAALPFLESVVPNVLRAGDRPSVKPPLRFGIFTLTGGTVSESWVPQERGELQKLPSLLRSLEPHKSELLVLSNLSQSGDSSGGINAHEHCAYLHLTASNSVGKVDGKPFAGQSVDQRAAEIVGPNSLLPSMQLGYSGGETSYFFDRQGRSLPVERDPRLAFNRMFKGPQLVAPNWKRRLGSGAGQPGQGEPGAGGNVAPTYDRQVVDLVLEDARRLKKQLGSCPAIQMQDTLMSSRNARPDPDCKRRARTVSCRSVLGIAVVAVWVLTARSLPAAEMPGDVKAFFEKHCVECHDPQSRKGGLDLTTQAVNLGDAPSFLRWVRLHDRVQSGEMPPKESPRPKAEEIKPVLDWLSQTLSAEELQRRQKNGRSVVRRMNRAEFQNTLRDLLDVPWIEVQELLPDDGRADGYTKTAAALDVSPVLLAKYAEAIDKALDAAVAKWSVPPEVERRTLFANQQYDYKVLMSGGDAVMLTPEMKYDESRFPMPSATNADGNYPGGKWSFGGKYKGLGEAEKDGVFKEGSTVGMTRTFGESFGGRFNFAPVHPGRYQIGVSAWSYWWDEGEVKPSPRSGSVGVYCGSRLLGFVDAPSLKPTYSELNVDIAPTEENHLRAAGTSFLDAHVYFSQGQIKAYSGAGVAIDKLVVTGPLYDEWPPASHRRLFGNLPIVPFAKLPSDAPKPDRPKTFRQARGASNGPGRLVPGATVSDDPAGDARRLLATFLPRAFRRPVSDAEVQRYAAIADARGKEGVSFEDALLESYRTALLSPDFLFLNESNGKLDGYAVASRLSYLLWISCPDDALLAAARAGTLNDPKGLRATADRLLGDPKADRFYQDFPDQWLDLRDFDLTSPDKQLYPEFQPYLEDAMRREPSEFFKFAVRNRLPVSHLLSTPINVVSQRLAEHYGIPGVEGTRFRRVDVDQTKNTRGGFLTMAAVCKVTANGSTTSPVKRGAWVMKKILGQTPQAPPPDVPAIEPDVKGATTIREQLAKHREDTACAGCHARFDPPGFALESYDVIGGWRDFYRATEGKKAPDFARIFRSYLTPDEAFKNHVNFRDGQPVDASGELIDGRKFAALREYQALLNGEAPVFSRNLANQLVVYATGAPVSFADRPAVAEILKHAGGTNPNLNELLHQVIQSPLFQNK